VVLTVKLTKDLRKLPTSPNMKSGLHFIPRCLKLKHFYDPVFYTSYYHFPVWWAFLRKYSLILTSPKPGFTSGCYGPGIEHRLQQWETINQLYGMCPVQTFIILTILRLFMVFFSPPREILGQYNILCLDHILTTSLFTNHSKIQP
jgi:hypothetical protein